eukprot:232768-Lingulodinium_polyedra.AAC.1
MHWSKRCANDARTQQMHQRSARTRDGWRTNVWQLTTNAAPAGNSQRPAGWACNARAHSVLENWAQH